MRSEDKGGRLQMVRREGKVKEKDITYSYFISCCDTKKTPEHPSIKQIFRMST